MEYVLMHKDIPVCDIKMSETVSAIESIGKVYNVEHIPVGITSDNIRINLIKLNKWYRGRSIPASRSGLAEALDIIGVEHQDELILKCYGLSLSDQYWLKPSNSDIKWSDINFFENDFSEDVGNALFGNKPESDEFSLMSPDNTSDGWLKKQWKIINGDRCLIKAGSAPYYQEPLNEKIASMLQAQLNYMPYVDYEVIYNDDKPLSVCKNFINKNTELISAYSIYESLDKNKETSSIGHFRKCCATQGIADVDKFIDYMLAVDFIIANSDRHLRNFGVIRNAETLEWIGFAPLFDCGTSLWYDKIAKNIKPVKFDESKPFANTHSKQIKLVNDISWIDFAKLQNFGERCRGVFEASEYIDERRCESLCYAIDCRIKMLEETV